MKKVNFTIEFYIFKLVCVGTKFQLKLTKFFGPSFPKRVFPVKNRKSKLHHAILHIRISLGTKF